MKYVRSIPVFLLLIIFPLISWVYLKRGFDFRKGALTELESKKLITNLQAEFPDGTDFTQDDLKNKVSILYDADVGSSYDFLSSVYDEFANKNEFQIIGLSTDSVENFTFENKENWHILYGSYEFDASLSLIDTALMIRNYYEFDSSDFTKLGQHLTIVIPKEKEKDVVMKSKNR